MSASQLNEAVAEEIVHGPKHNLDALRQHVLATTKTTLPADIESVQDAAVAALEVLRSGPTGSCPTRDRFAGEHLHDSHVGATIKIIEEIKSTGTSTSLAGAWSGGPEGYEGMFVFSDTHYNGFFATKERTPFADPSAPTESEQATAFTALFGGSGTYRVSRVDNEIVFHTMYDRNPRDPYFNFMKIVELTDRSMIFTASSGRTWVFKKLS